MATEPIERVEIWHFQFRISFPDTDKRSFLINDRIAVEPGTSCNKAAELAKAVFEIPAEAKVEQRFCMRDHSVVLPVGHVLVQVAKSNEELAS